MNITDIYFKPGIKPVQDIQSIVCDRFSTNIKILAGIFILLTFVCIYYIEKDTNERAKSISISFLYAIIFGLSIIILKY